MIRDLTANPERMRAATASGHITATDLADWLVRELGLPFREAHHVTGEIVGRAEEKGCDLAALDLGEMKAVEPRITEGIFQVLTVEQAVASRTSQGGTSPERVREAVAGARRRFL